MKGIIKLLLCFSLLAITCSVFAHDKGTVKKEMVKVNYAKPVVDLFQTESTFSIVVVAEVTPIIYVKECVIKPKSITLLNDCSINRIRPWEIRFAITPYTNKEKYYPIEVFKFIMPYSRGSDRS